MRIVGEPPNSVKNVGSFDYPYIIVPKLLSQLILSRQKGLVGFGGGGGGGSNGAPCIHNEIGTFDQKSDHSLLKAN